MHLVSSLHTDTSNLSAMECCSSILVSPLSLSLPSPMPYISPPPCTHTCMYYYQENHLGSSLHIDSSNLTASAALIQDKIMAALLPTQLEKELRQRLAQEPFSDSFVAVRSSGTDEDSATHSFAGQWGMC